MAELHSFHLCQHVILMAFTWAWNKVEQAINRIHRLNSPAPVHVWSIMCERSIDRRLESLLQEKGDASDLVLDGRLYGDNLAEVNLAELLHATELDFASSSPNNLPDESALERSWPAARQALSAAWKAWGSTQSIIKPPPLFIEPAPELHSATAAPVGDYTSLPLWRQAFRRRQLTKLAA